MAGRNDLEGGFAEIFEARRRVRAIAMALAFIIAFGVTAVIVRGYVTVRPDRKSFDELKKGAKRCAYKGCAMPGSTKTDVKVDYDDGGNSTVQFQLCAIHNEMATTGEWPDTRNKWLLNYVAIGLAALIAGLIVMGITKFIFDVNPYLAAPPPGSFP